MFSAMPTWRMLLVQVVLRACSRACAKTGKRIAAKMAIMAITTSSSISVKPRPRHPNCCMVSLPESVGHAADRFLLEQHRTEDVVARAGARALNDRDSRHPWQT